jgi:hypothetical protein
MVKYLLCWESTELEKLQPLKYYPEKSNKPQEMFIFQDMTLELTW